MADSHPFFRGGYRPFFTSGALWALVALILWLGALSGTFTLPTHFDSLAWHRHEMLFGFVGAVITGFLLTAIPNWTGRLPIAGGPLALLFGLWLAARAAVLFSTQVGPLVAALLDVGFYVVLAALAAREVLAAKNRNAPVVLLVLLFAIANALDHGAAAGLIGDEGVGTRAAIVIVILMISLIGGRVVPSFTRNWLVKQGAQNGLPTQPGRFDIIVITATALAMAGWLIAPFSSSAGFLLLVAAALQAVRLARWSGVRAWRDPLVLVLHVGYAWVPVGLCLLGLSILGTAVPGSGAIHALTAGAMGTMILAVMTRATLGHTGRELKADGATVMIYVLVTVGALGRVAAPLLPMDYMLAVRLSGMAWGGAFLLFLLVYGPKLAGPRPDGRP
ncbi:MAG: NnrS family protein [Sphingomonas bacterium]|nr:NnrS family protein [Sphingomonas bacterium]